MSEAKFQKAVEVVQSLPKDGPIKPSQDDQLFVRAPTRPAPAPADAYPAVLQLLQARYAPRSPRLYLRGRLTARMLCSDGRRREHLAPRDARLRRQGQVVSPRAVWACAVRAGAAASGAAHSILGGRWAIWRARRHSTL